MNRMVRRVSLYWEEAGGADIIGLAPEARAEAGKFLRPGLNAEALALVIRDHLITGPDAGRWGIELRQ